MENRAALGEVSSVVLGAVDLFALALVVETCAALMAWASQRVSRESWAEHISLKTSSAHAV